MSEKSKLSGAELLELQLAIQNSKGWAIFWKIRKLQVTHRTFKLNECDLISLLKSHASPDNMPTHWNMANRSKMDEAHYDLARFLHNYVAAAMTLVVHTRVLVRRILDGSSIQEYDKEIEKRFKDDLLSSFVQDLRNYFMHQENPVTSSNVEFKDGRIARTGMRLKKESLSEYSGWKKNAQRFIDSTSEDLWILDFIEVYSRKVEDFQSWLIPFLEKKNESELKPMHHAQDALMAHYKSQGIPTSAKDWEKLDRSEQKDGN